MKAAKIVASEYLINDQKADWVLQWSARFCSKSAGGGVIIRTVHYHSNFNRTCSSFSLSPFSSSPTPATQITHCLPLSHSQEGLRTETTGISDSVRVKFQIKKECQFGDHILMVGDDPLLGSWSPLNAIPFNWSEGHLWTLVLEMPVNQSFKYKFLLKKSSGEVLWQPGPDRVFTSWETENVIIVCEEWTTAEAQKIIEQRIIDENEQVISKTSVDVPVHIIAENITVTGSDENITVNRNISGQNVEADSHSKDDPSSRATKKAVISSGKNSQEKGLTRKGGQKGVREEKSSSIEAEGSLVTSDEGPVLVPGLTVMLDSENDRVNEHQKSILTDSEPRFEVSRNQEYHIYRFD